MHCCIGYVTAVRDVTAVHQLSTIVLQLHFCSSVTSVGSRLPAHNVQAQPRIHLPDAKAKALMERIQNAGTEVVEAKV